MKTWASADGSGSTYARHEECPNGMWVHWDDVRELQTQNVILHNRLELAFKMMDSYVDNAAVVRRIKELVGRTT